MEGFLSTRSGLISYKDHGLSNPKILLKSKSYHISKTFQQLSSCPQPQVKSKSSVHQALCDLPHHLPLCTPSSLCFNDTGWSPVPHTHPACFVLALSLCPEHPYPSIHMPASSCVLVAYSMPTNQRQPITALYSTAAHISL